MTAEVFEKTSCSILVDFTLVLVNQPAKITQWRIQYVLRNEVVLDQSKNLLASSTRPTLTIPAL